MKKLKLSNLDLTAILSREELKKIAGGNFGSGSGSTDKVGACVGKSDGSYCVWTSPSGTSYGGYCRSYIAGPLHCSDLI